MSFSKPNDIVWGAGCIDFDSIGDNPKKVYAVRGPLTRQELLKRGIKCPEIYGDPALLFPEIYNPPRNIKYEYGIIPHYIDYTDNDSLKIITSLESQGVKVINITAGIFRFIDELLQVEKVLSSSLHGLIAADAYGIPNIRVGLSDKLIGGDFKFSDYALSVNKPQTICVFNSTSPNIKELSDLDYTCDIKWNKQKLLDAGPWNDPKCNFF